MLLTELDEPKNYNEAIGSPDGHLWHSAMKEEMNSLRKNCTWTKVNLPPDRKPISNRWVYRIKRKANGDVDRFKARLVVHGFSQRKGLEYNESFGPVARFDAIKSILSIAAKEKLEMAQLIDVKTAFLNSPIDEEIYMMQPEGFDDGRPCVQTSKEFVWFEAVT